MAINGQHKKKVKEKKFSVASRFEPATVESASALAQLIMSLLVVPKSWVQIWGRGQKFFKFFPKFSIISEIRVR